MNFNLEGHEFDGNKAKVAQYQQRIEKEFEKWRDFLGVKHSSPAEQERGVRLILNTKRIEKTRSINELYALFEHNHIQALPENDVDPKKVFEEMNKGIKSGNIDLVPTVFGLQAQVKLLLEVERREMGGR